MPGGPLLELASALAALAHAADATLVVNDRADIARLAGAAGVHVGQDDLSPRDVRMVFDAGGRAAIVGLSTHTPSQLDAALDTAIDYVAVGPVFATATKTTGHEPIGLDRVTAAALAARARAVPVVAIGGITLANAPSVVAAGAQAVAVIGDLLTAGSPEARVRAYLLALARVGPRPNRHV
jgi:thiamine-phosphate pyrophosphorylase